MTRRPATDPTMAKGFARDFFKAHKAKVTVNLKRIEKLCTAGNWTPRFRNRRRRDIKAMGPAFLVTDIDSKTVDFMHWRCGEITYFAPVNSDEAIPFEKDWNLSLFHSTILKAEHQYIDHKWRNAGVTLTGHALFRLIERAGISSETEILTALLPLVTHGRHINDGLSERARQSPPKAPVLFPIEGGALAGFIGITPRGDADVGVVVQAGVEAEYHTFLGPEMLNEAQQKVIAALQSELGQGSPEPASIREIFKDEHALMPAQGNQLQARTDQVIIDAGGRPIWWDDPDQAKH